MKQDRSEIANVFATFYEDLYRPPKLQVAAQAICSSFPVPAVTPAEVEQQLKKMKKSKAPDTGGIVAECLKHGGHTLMETLAELFTDVL